jgi:phage-related protein
MIRRVWTVETASAVVDAELRELPPDLRARFVRFTEIIGANGLEHLPRDAVKHLEGKLWEMRLIGSSGIARAIYVTAVGQRVVVVHAFVKKTQKTPARDLEIARQRAKEIR